MADFSRSLSMPQPHSPPSPPTPPPPALSSDPYPHPPHCRWRAFRLVAATTRPLLGLHSFLRRVSTGSCVSLMDACGEGGGGGKSSKDVSKPSPCDVTAFAPVTPFRDGFPGMPGADSGGRDDAPMSPVPDADGGVYVPAGKAGGIGVSGRFATDFEELEVIGSGSFGTVYKVGGGRMEWGVVGGGKGRKA